MNFERFNDVNNSTFLIARDRLTNDVEIIHHKGKKSFTLTNILNIDYLKIDSPGLEYKINQGDIPNNFTVQYFPKGKRYEVAIRYNDCVVNGTPFTLCPKPAKIKFNFDKKIISVYHIHEIDKLKVSSKRLSYKIFQDEKDSTTYHINYDIGQEFHDVDVIYQNEVIENGSFRLVPKHLRELYERESSLDNLHSNSWPSFGDENWAHRLYHRGHRLRSTSNNCLNNVVERMVYEVEESIPFYEERKCYTEAIGSSTEPRFYGEVDMKDDLNIFFDENNISLVK